MASFDFTKLTLGEIAYIEDLSGQSVAALDDDALPKGKPLAAICVIIKRRNGEPGFTFNDAMALPMDEATALVTGLAADDAVAIEADASGEERRADESATD